MQARTGKRWVFGLALAVVPLFGGEPKAALAPIALYSEFDQAPPKAVTAALQSELATIMLPLGLRFEWRDLHGPRDDFAVELAVVTFKGRCNVAGLSPHTASSPGALGWTHISDGVILPFSDVDCDGIRVFLQRSLLGISTSDREEVFGHALARVLAHELYHIFADTTRHGSCGIAKEAYSVRDLLSTGFRFEDRESKALKNSKAYGLLEKGPDLRY
jgi:hypothetical protein